MVSHSCGSCSQDSVSYTGQAVCLVSESCRTKLPSTWWLNTTEVYSLTSSGGWKPEIKFLAEFLPSEGSRGESVLCLLQLLVAPDISQCAVASLPSLPPSSPGFSSFWPLFSMCLKGHSLMDLGPTCISLDDLIFRSLITSAKTLFPNKVTFAVIWEMDLSSRGSLFHPVQVMSSWKLLMLLITTYLIGVLAPLCDFLALMDHSVRKLQNWGR